MRGAAVSKEMNVSEGKIIMNAHRTFRALIREEVEGMRGGNSAQEGRPLCVMGLLNEL